MSELLLEPVQVDGAPDELAEMISLNFDARTLRVTMDFPRSPERSWVYLDFQFPRGFRVLQEGDLIELWAGAPAKASFLHRVSRGGWFDQESQRSGFLTQSQDVSEYLIIGETECVSVLATTEPLVTLCQ